MALFVAAIASHRRALSVRMVAKTIHAPKHRPLDYAALSDMPFLVAAVALY